jgi:ABC-type glycerol-3-phosphate transport system substrate-binding protein
MTRPASLRNVLARFAMALLAAGAVLPVQAAEARRLVVWMVGDDKTPRLIESAVLAFKAEHPGIEVEVRDVPWADAMTKYSAALASRRGPDLITGSTTYAIDLGTKGALVDLGQRAPDVVRLLEQFANPGALRAVRRPDGTIYAAPFDMHVQMQFYRTDLLPRAPATWSEFVSAIESLRARAREASRSSGATPAGSATTPTCSRPAAPSTTRAAAARWSTARRRCVRWSSTLPSTTA